MKRRDHAHRVGGAEWTTSAALRQPRGRTGIASARESAPRSPHVRPSATRETPRSQRSTDPPRRRASPRPSRTGSRRRSTRMPTAPRAESAARRSRRTRAGPTTPSRSIESRIDSGFSSIPSARRSVAKDRDQDDRTEQGSRPFCETGNSRRWRVPSALAPVNLARARRVSTADRSGAAPGRVRVDRARRRARPCPRPRCASVPRSYRRSPRARRARADPDLHELVIAERAIERRDHARRDAGRADLHHRVEHVRERRRWRRSRPVSSNPWRAQARVAEGRAIAAAVSQPDRLAPAANSEARSCLRCAAGSGPLWCNRVQERDADLGFESCDHTTVTLEAGRGWFCSSHRTLRGPPSWRPLALGFACTILPSSPLSGATARPLQGPGRPPKE